MQGHTHTHRNNRPTTSTHNENQRVKSRAELGLVDCGVRLDYYDVFSIWVVLILTVALIEVNERSTFSERLIRLTV